MEKLILEFNENEFERQLNSAKETANTINQRIKDLTGYGLKLNDSQLFSLFNQMNLSFASELIPDKVKGDLKRQIELETIEQFLSEAIQDLPEMDFLTFEKGKCIVSDERIEHLRSRLTKSINTPQGIEFYNKLTKATELLNEAFNGSIPFLWRAILQERDNQFIINIDANFDELASTRQN